MAKTTISIQVKDCDATLPKLAVKEKYERRVREGKRVNFPYGACYPTAANIIQVSR